MKSIAEAIKERNILLDTTDRVVRQGFTQVPNCILRDSALSVGAKVVYAMFLSYAWHNDSCFPGQDRLSGMRRFSGWSGRTSGSMMGVSRFERRRRRRPAGGWCRFCRT